MAAARRYAGSLAEYVAAHPAPKPGPVCSVCSLPKAIRADVEKGLRTPTMRRGQISGWLKKLGYQVSTFMLGRHARDHAK